MDSQKNQLLALTQDERVRRVLLICVRLTSSLACYRVLREQQFAHLLHHSTKNPAGWFWILQSNNSIDTCVMEWCKLFADKKGRHHWRFLFGELTGHNGLWDTARFEVDLLANLNKSEGEFKCYVTSFVRYRDKFVAHLDDERLMQIPDLEPALTSVCFLYSWICEQYGTFSDLPADIGVSYLAWQELARKVLSER